MKNPALGYANAKRIISAALTITRGEGRIHVTSLDIGRAMIAAQREAKKKETA